MPEIVFRISPALSNEQLNALFITAWEDHQARDFQPVLRHSLLYVCAYDGEQMVGFVNVAWDGGIHGFLLDTTVHADFQHRGIGAKLVQKAIEAARERGLEWLHVDFEPHLSEFYRRCGFRATDAGLIKLIADQPE
ncbi:MAG: GNAT family N-acetyltransferase [Anaerolineae bacterium]|nr:GNAT family N-acetyltransferase [Anaerolineae bacterium]